eukprot:9671257-Lingulodinium_polyedra.AAC.1
MPRGSEENSRRGRPRPPRNPNAKWRAAKGNVIDRRRARHADVRIHDDACGAARGVQREDGLDRN